MFGTFNSDLSSTAPRRALGQAHRFSRSKKRLPRQQDGVSIPAYPNTRLRQRQGVESCPAKKAAKTGSNTNMKRRRNSKNLERKAPQTSEASKSRFSFDKWIKGVTSNGSIIDSTYTMGGASSLWQDDSTSPDFIDWLGRRVAPVADDQVSHGRFGSVLRKRTTRDGLQGNSYDTSSGDSRDALGDLLSYRKEECRTTLRNIPLRFGADKRYYELWTKDRASEWAERLRCEWPDKEAMMMEFLESSRPCWDPAEAQPPVLDTHSVWETDRIVGMPDVSHGR